MTTDTIRLAERMRDIGLSPTMKGTIEAERLRRQGVDVVDLGAGRAGLPDARARDGGGARGARQPVHEVHGQHGHAGAARGGRPTRYREDYGVELRARRGHHHGRRQAGAAITPRWRSSGRATKSSRTCPAGRRSSSRSSSPARRRSSCATQLEDGFALDGRRAALGRHAAHARHRHQLAGQSDRRAAVRVGSAQARRRGRAPRALGRDRSLLRTADLRRRPAQPAEGLRRRRCAIGWCCAGRRRRPMR